MNFGQRASLSSWHWWVLGCMVVSLVGHLFVVDKLNVVEDESAYVMDAAQITPSFLPFREFGGTKGPVYLFVLQQWQHLFGRSIEVSRLFSIVCHLLTIPLLGILARRLFSDRASYIATLFWAISPVVVSLTTNITHIPFELVLILLVFLLLTDKREKDWVIMVAGVVYMLAILSRATAIAFAPLCLYLLVVFPHNRVKRVLQFGGAALAFLILVLLIIFPLYGWPKTAFFFNADALLIAQGQKAVYQAQQTVSFGRALFLSTQPIWIDHFSLVVLALAALAGIVSTRFRWVAAIIALVSMWYGTYELGLFYVYLETEFSLVAFYIWLRLGIVAVISLILLLGCWRKISVSALHPWRIGIIALCWLGAFYLFYKGWGRSPTPFYPLESTPVLVLLVAGWVSALWGDRRFRKYLVVLGVTMVVELVVSYSYIPLKQYRGTTELPAAKAMVAIMQERIPPGSVIFTAQPMYPFLANMPLLGGYTHPGWYLSERAGYMPRFIRHMFLPDLPNLLKEVEASVDWIVLDWRTQDVYFKDGVEETEAFRALLKEKFVEVAAVKNEASREIILMQRK